MQYKNRKILVTATTELFITSFLIPYLEWFNQQGYEVHVAYNGSSPISFVTKVWNVPFGRSPLAKSNLYAYKQLKSIINNNSYDLVHCHTPMASVITRLASQESRKNGTIVLYTAHGFHFYKGGPIKNWLIFYPIEKLLSYLTDGIVTINKEDLKILNEKKFKSSGKYQIPGIGINPDRLSNLGQKDKFLMADLGISEDDIVVLYIAEFIPRKNHEFIINAIPELLKENNKIKFLFAGGGILKNRMERIVNEKNIDKNVVFLGFVDNIGRYINLSHIGVSSSKQEGLGLGIAELMYNEVPVVVTQDRGHRELVTHCEDGFLFSQNDKNEFVKYILKLVSNSELRNKMGKKGRLSMSKFLIDNSLKKMVEIYKIYLK